MTQAGKHSKKRGDNTREDLLHAGLLLFGEYGLNGVSTRMLAAEAKANIASIPYHFGGKEGLYKAVVQHIADQIGIMTQPVMQSINQEIETSGADLSPERARALCVMAKSKMAELFIGMDHASAWSKIIMREQANPTDAFDILYESEMKTLQQTSEYLVAAALEISPQSHDAKIISHAIWGQVLVFITSRESLLRTLKVTSLGAQHRKKIQNIIEQLVNSCLKP